MLYILSNRSPASITGRDLLRRSDVPSPLNFGTLKDTCGQFNGWRTFENNSGQVSNVLVTIWRMHTSEHARKPTRRTAAANRCPEMLSGTCCLISRIRDNIILNFFLDVDHRRSISNGWPPPWTRQFWRTSILYVINCIYNYNIFQLRLAAASVGHFWTSDPASIHSQPQYNIINNILSSFAYAPPPRHWSLLNLCLVINYLFIIIKSLINITIYYLFIYYLQIVKTTNVRHRHFNTAQPPVQLSSRGHGRESAGPASLSILSRTDPGKVRRSRWLAEDGPPLPECQGMNTQRWCVISLSIRRFGTFTDWVRLTSCNKTFEKPLYIVSIQSKAETTFGVREFWLFETLGLLGWTRPLREREYA